MFSLFLFLCFFVVFPFHFTIVTSLSLWICFSSFVHSSKIFLYSFQFPPANPHPIFCGTCALSFPLLISFCFFSFMSCRASRSHFLLISSVSFSLCLPGLSCAYIFAISSGFPFIFLIDVSPSFFVLFSPFLYSSAVGCFSNKVAASPAATPVCLFVWCSISPLLVSSMFPVLIFVYVSSFSLSSFFVFSSFFSLSFCPFLFLSSSFSFCSSLSFSCFSLSLFCFSFSFSCICFCLSISFLFFSASLFAFSLCLLFSSCCPSFPVLTLSKWFPVHVISRSSSTVGWFGSNLCGLGRSSPALPISCASGIP